MMGRYAMSLAVVLTLFAAGGVEAQQASAARVVNARSHEVPIAVGRAMPATLAIGARADSTGKSALAAGFLSFVVPGVGSYYAGNASHGTVHLGVALGAGLVGLAVCGQGRDAPCGGASNAAAIVSLVNWVWSIGTAVHDARTAP